jgi:hypothetical protein
MVMTCKKIDALLPKNIGIEWDSTSNYVLGILGLFWENPGFLVRSGKEQSLQIQILGFGVEHKGSELVIFKTITLKWIKSQVETTTLALTHQCLKHPVIGLGGTIEIPLANPNWRFDCWVDQI